MRVFEPKLRWLVAAYAVVLLLAWRIYVVIARSVGQ